MKMIPNYPNYCFECEAQTYIPDGEYNNAEAEVKMIEHLDWYHFDEAAIKANWATLVNDVSTIANMVANDNWFEAYIESADIRERIQLALKGIRHFSQVDF